MTEDHLELTEADSARSSSLVRRLTADNLDIAVSTSSVEDDQIWNELRDILDSKEEGSVRVAVATADETISTESSIDQDQLRDIHATELVARTAYSETESPLTHVLVQAEEEFTPCGQCLETIIGLSEEVTFRIDDSSSEDYREISLDSSSLFDSLEKATLEESDTDAKETTNNDDSNSLTVPEEPPMIDVDVDEEAEVEFARLNSPTFHLKYKKQHRTFCGTDLTNREWFSSTEEPVLLEPCKMCYGESGPKSAAAQKEELRAQLADTIDQIESVEENPGVFTDDELIAVAESLPVEISSHDADNVELREQLSRAIVDVKASSDAPSTFSLSEMNALVDAVDGVGTISKEPHLFVCTSNGRAARIHLSQFKQQHRGGKGQKGLSLLEDEALSYTLGVNPRDSIYVFTNLGQIYELDAHRVPGVELGRSPTPISDIVDFDDGESLHAAVSCSSLLEHDSVVFGTQNGYIKRTETGDFKNIRSTGIRAIELQDGDELQEVCLIDGDEDIFMVTKEGRAIRFAKSEVRPMGRAARGVRGIELDQDDKVAAIEVINPQAPLEVLTITEGGYGKRTEVEEYRKQTRAGRGLVDIYTGDRNGAVVGIETATTGDRCVTMTEAGRSIHTAVDEITVQSRNTKGVKIMQTEDDDLVAELAVFLS